MRRRRAGQGVWGTPGWALPAEQVRCLPTAASIYNASVKRAFVESMPMLIEHSTSRLFGSQILVFHFPGMIERVKGGVPYQVPQRPLAGQFTL
jgi:hypothetical protein